MGAPLGAERTRSGSLAASAAIASIAPAKASTASRGSVSVGSIISASSTIRGK